MFHVKRDRFAPVTTLILNDESGLAQGLLPSNRDQGPGRPDVSRETDDGL